MYLVPLLGPHRVLRIPEPGYYQLIAGIQFAELHLDMLRKDILCLDYRKHEMKTYEASRVNSDRLLLP